MSRSARNAGKKGRLKKVLLIVIPAVIVVLLGGYAFGSNYYASRFEPQTSINNIDVSGMTANEAQEALANYYNGQNFTITDNGQEWKTLPIADLGVTADTINQISAHLQDQNNWAWGTALFSDSDLSVDSLSLDEETLNTALAEITSEINTLNEGRTVTQDATIVKNETGFSVQDAVVGDNINAEAAMAAISEAIANGSFTIELENYITQPTITADNADLQNQLTSLNNIAQVNATYSINGTSFQIPTETIADWLTYTDGQVGLDNDKVTAYVTDLGTQYNTSTNPTSFASTLRGTVSVPAGTYSWSIQTGDEVAALTEQILAGEDFTRTPITSGATTADHALIGNTYIEVDLVNQHMWYYKDGALVLETDIVSGRPSMATPTGVNYVWNKERNATLVGEDYQTPVSYWMPIDWTGVGIHDSSWQSAYGGDRYTTNGSHGCINTPPSVMATLYESVSVGTPVLVI
ncbi:L,D-transpeptidase family protein [Enterococcus sp. LJL120]